MQFDPSIINRIVGACEPSSASTEHTAGALIFTHPKGTFSIVVVVPEETLTEPTSSPSGPVTDTAYESPWSSGDVDRISTMALPVSAAVVQPLSVPASNSSATLREIN